MEKKELLRIKEQIDEAKTNATELKGKLKYQQEQLKTEWNCDSMKAAESKVKEIEKKVEKINSQIREGTKELEEQYDFNTDS